MGMVDRRFWGWLLGVLVLLSPLLTGCDIPRVSAEDRLFRNISLEFLDDYRLPKQTFRDTPVGGLSAIAYDAQKGLYYAVSDDRSEFAPARFYTLKINLDTSDPTAVKIGNVTVENVTFVTDEQGQPYPKGGVDLEGIGLSPERTLFISSEGVAQDGIPPFVRAFELTAGTWQQSLPVPQRYFPDAPGEAQKSGVGNNLGFESLTISASGVGAREPFRVFVATESSLVQDQEPANPDRGPRNRLLHFLVEEGRSLLLAEHLYPLEVPPPGARFYGLTELLAIDQGGHLLSLERSFGDFGFGAKLFQIAMGSATDTSTIPSLRGELKSVEPLRKRLVADLGLLDLPLDNLEGMTLGPPLPDGSQSLLVISDDNFNDRQVSQFLLFRLKMR